MHILIKRFFACCLTILLVAHIICGSFAIVPSEVDNCFDLCISNVDQSNEGFKTPNIFLQLKNNINIKTFFDLDQIDYNIKTRSKNLIVISRKCKFKISPKKAIYNVRYCNIPCCLTYYFSLNSNQLCMVSQPIVYQNSARAPDFI